MSEPLAGRDLAWLERRRAELFGLISQVGDFRRGALNAVWRKCGKPNCACARPGHRGYGPQWNLTRRVAGQDGECAPEAGAGAGEGAAGGGRASAVRRSWWRRSRLLVRRSARPGRWPGQLCPLRRRGKGLLTGLQEIAAAEVAAPAGLAAGMLGSGAALAASGAPAAPSEAALAVLAAGDGYAGPHVTCADGHQAVFAGCRDKAITTCWGRCGDAGLVPLPRCGHGFAPRDEQLGTAGRRCRRACAR